MEPKINNDQLNILEVLGRKEVEVQAMKQKIQQLHKQIEDLEKRLNGNIVNETSG